jgi:hypothetical protein
MNIIHSYVLDYIQKKKYTNKEYQLNIKIKNNIIKYHKSL